MRKSILIIAGLLTLLVLLFLPSTSGLLLALLLLGMIPGTSFAIPAWIMLLGSMTGIILSIRWISRQPLYIGSHSQQEKMARQLARKKILAMSAAMAPAPAPTPVTRRRTAKA